MAADPVIRALATLLDCSYLDEVPTSDVNDRIREVASEAKIAHDANRADAARWRKVAPLIERLRGARYGCTADGEHDAVTAILDATDDNATKEPTP
jgi:hypothetical protein